MIAKMIGTAPFSPTQESSNLSRWRYWRKGNIQIHTERGRAIKIIAIEINNPGSQTW